MIEKKSVRFSTYLCFTSFRLKDVICSFLLTTDNKVMHSPCKQFNWYYILTKFDNWHGILHLPITKIFQVPHSFDVWEHSSYKLVLIKRAVSTVSCSHIRLFWNLFLCSIFCSNPWCIWKTRGHIFIQFGNELFPSWAWGIRKKHNEARS